MSHMTRGIGAGLLATALLLLAAVSPVAAQSIYGNSMGGGGSYGQSMMQTYPSQFNRFDNRFDFHVNPFFNPFRFERIRIHFGDTLSEIAARFHVSQNALLRANPQIEDPDLIFAGRKLVIPFRSFHRGY